MLNSGRKKLLKLFLDYSFAEILAKGLNWGVLIILPYLVDKEDYGFIGLLVAFESLLLPIIIGGQQIAMLRFLHRFRFFSDIFEKSLFSSWVKWLAVVIVPSLIITILFFNPCLPYLILFVTIIFSALKEIILSKLRVNQSTKEYIRVRVIFQLSKFILVVVFALLSFNIFIYPLSVLLANLILIVFAWQIFKSSVQKISYKSSNKRLSNLMMRFSIPITFHALSLNLLVYVNRYLIKDIMGIEAVGEFTFAYSISFALFFVSFIGSVIFQPILYRIKKANHLADELLGMYTNLLSVILIISASVLFVGTDLILGLKDDYDISIALFHLLLLSMLFEPFYNNANFRIVLQNRTLLLPISTLIATIINIVFIYLLSPTYNLEGVAMSLLIARLTLVLLLNIFTGNIRSIYNYLLLLVVLTAIFLVINSYENFIYITVLILLIYNVWNILANFKDYKAKLTQYV